MEHRRAFITVADGTRLAAQLWLPDERPAPVVIEALPYRMDDLTSAYASEYERLCEEGGFAVCRLDIRGTGSSEGIATDEYTAAELDDICQVIAWLAEQEWSNGRVGMYGTSWSGFNSLQVACLRPPALHAIVPIYASDDRYNDDVHYMGGALKAIDLIDYELYMVAGNALPPVPAVFGPGWRERVGAASRRRRAMAAALDRGAGRRAVLAARLGAAGLRPDHLPDDDRRRLGRRLHEHRLPRLRGALVPEARDPRPVGARVDRHRAAGAAHRPRPGADPLVPPLARRRAERRRRGAADRGVRPPLDAARRRISPRCAASGAARRRGRRSGSRSRCCGPTGEGTDTIHVRGDVGQTAWISCAGKLPWGLPDDQRVDDALSLTYDWEPLAADLDVMGHPRVRLTVTSPVPVAYLSAKLCDVFPDGTSALAGRGLLNLTHRDGHDAPRRARARRPDRGRDRARGDLVDLRAGPSRAALARRRRLAEHLAAAERRAARRSIARASSSSCRCSTGRSPLPAAGAAADDRQGHACAGRRTTSSRRRSGGSRTTRSAHESRCGHGITARTTRRRSGRGSRSGTRARPASRRTTLRSRGPGARTVYRITWPEADVRTEATLDLRSDADGVPRRDHAHRRGARRRRPARRRSTASGGSSGRSRGGLPDATAGRAADSLLAVAF